MYAPTCLYAVCMLYACVNFTVENFNITKKGGTQQFQDGGEIKKGGNDWRRGDRNVSAHYATNERLALRQEWENVADINSCEKCFSGKMSQNSFYISFRWEYVAKKIGNMSGWVVSRRNMSGWKNARVRLSQWENFQIGKCRSATLSGGNMFGWEINKWRKVQWETIG